MDVQGAPFTGCWPQALGRRGQQPGEDAPSPQPWKGRFGEGWGLKEARKRAPSCSQKRGEIEEMGIEQKWIILIATQAVGVFFFFLSESKGKMVLSLFSRGIFFF